MKFIFVTGGVVSSLGKGLAAASLGTLLETRGLKVTLQKFDPYLNVDPGTNAVLFSLTNDSSLATKSTQTTELNLGYSRRAWSNEAGSLYLGAEARIYLMRLSRLSVRFGDITDSEALFDAIRHNDFRNDEDFGVDVGALWVGNKPAAEK